MYSSVQSRIHSLEHYLHKYLPSQEERLKYKRQCLKEKNILFENEKVQIGSKITSLYDFYESKNLAQISIFIGNKTSQPIDEYDISFQGTGNLKVYLQEREHRRLVREKTQSKQRLIIEWINSDGQKNPNGEIFLVMNFTSPVATLNATVIPLTLFSFLSFPIKEAMEAVFPTRNLSVNDIVSLFREKYELFEEFQLSINPSMFKKGVEKDFEKYFGGKMIRVSQNSMVGVFTVKNMWDEMGILLSLAQTDKNSKESFSKSYSQLSNQNITPSKATIKIFLAGDSYEYFEGIHQNLKMLIGE